MMITVVCLDDNEKYLKTIQQNISSLESSFFQKNGFEIDGIKILIATNPAQAFDLINNNDVSVLVLDIELKGAHLGHEEYEILFFKGKAIPAIVVSAFATTPQRQAEIRSKGISIIIDKFEPSLSEKIAIAICTVFFDKRAKILQIRTFVEQLRISNNSVSINGDSKSIEEWIATIISGALSSSQENKIIQQLQNECIEKLRLDADHNPGFMRQT